MSTYSPDSFARSDSCRRHESTCHRRPGVNGKRRKPYRRKSRSPSPDRDTGPSGTSHISLPAPIPVHTPLSVSLSHSSSSSAQDSRPTASFTSSPNSRPLGYPGCRLDAMEPVRSGAHDDQRTALPYPIQMNPSPRNLTPHHDYPLPGGHDWHRPHLSTHYSAPSSLTSHDTSSSSSLMSSYEASPNGSTHMEPSVAWDSTGYHPADLVGAAASVHPTGSLAPPTRGRASSVGTQPASLEYQRPRESELTYHLPFPIGTSVPGSVNNSNSAHPPSGVHDYSTGSLLPSTAFHPSSAYPSSVRSHNNLAAYDHRADAGTSNPGILTPLNDVELRSNSRKKITAVNSNSLSVGLDSEHLL